MRCPTSSSILYLWSPFCKNGSIAKRFAYNELELAHVTGDLPCVMDEWLASVRQTESQGNELARLCKELEHLRVQSAMLSEWAKK